METKDYVGIGILLAGAYGLYTFSKQSGLSNFGNVDDDQLIANPNKLDNRSTLVDVSNDRIVTDPNIPNKDISNLDGRLILRVMDKSGNYTTYKTDQNKLTNAEKRAISSNNYLIENDTLITNPLHIAASKVSLAKGVVLQGLQSLIPKNSASTQKIEVTQNQQLKAAANISLPKGAANQMNNAMNSFLQQVSKAKSLRK